MRSILHGLGIAVVYALANAAAALRAQAYFTTGSSPGPLVTLLVLGLVAAAWMLLWRRLLASGALGEATSWRLALAAWGACALAVVLLYPSIDACRFAYAGGNDRDDALDGATRSLLALTHPYKTDYVDAVCGHHVGPGGNPMSPMPGALLMAAPFVLATGASAWQNLAWTLAWIFAARGLLGGARMAAGMVLLVLLSPQVFASEMLTGGDVIAYSLQALVAAYLVWHVRRPAWLGLFVLPALLGVALSTRPHMIVVLATLFLALRARHGWRDAIVQSGVAAAAWCAVTLPFYLADPAAFAPLQAGRLLDGFDALVGNARGWLSALLVLLLAGFALGGCRDFEGFCIATGVVLAAAAVYLTTLGSIHEGRVELVRYSWYALPGLVFITAGAWRRAMAPPQGAT